MTQQENIKSYAEYDQEDKQRIDQLYEETQKFSGEYHVKLKDGDDIDLYFIRPKDILVKYKKFNKKGEPPTVIDQKPDEDVEEADKYKEMWTFPIYDPASDKEGFIEFSGPSTIKSIMAYLHGTDKIPATNFIHIVRVGDGQATRYGVKAAK